MARRKTGTLWGQAFQRGLAALQRQTRRTLKAATTKALKPPPRALARATASDPGQWLPGAAVSVGGLRRYHAYRPRGVRPAEALPLLMMLHGCGQDAQRFAALTRMNRLAEQHRFMVLYPEQDRLANPNRCWNWFATQDGRADREAASLLAALDQVCLTQPVDRQRIAVVGLSAGASMAAVLALRAPERFRAVVMHSGVAPGSAHSALSALSAMRGRRQNTGPGGGHRDAKAGAAMVLPPLLVIQGANDRVVDATNGPAAAHFWASPTGATPRAARVLQRGQRHPMIITDYKVGGHLKATWIQVQALGHAWSGGAASEPYGDPHGPDASRLAWAFIARQWRPARQRA